MLNTLAKKYGVNQSEPDWEIKLFNMLCTSVDIESQIIEERKISQGLITDLQNIVADHRKYHVALSDMVSSKKLSAMFKSKVRKYLKEKKVTLDYAPATPKMPLR